MFPPRDLFEMSVVGGKNSALSILGTTNSDYNSTMLYLEFGTNELVKGMVDPWGGLIQFALDNGVSCGDATAYDGKVRVGSFGNIYDSVAVWSKGPDPDDEADDVRGW